MIEQKVIEAYSEGSPISLIASSFKISDELILDILKRFKEENRYKKTFTDKFKKIIAQRDMNGVARSTIANELDINANTVKKSCEQFGQAIKEKSLSEKAFTRIDGEFDLKSCPSCGSKRVNLVDDNTTYCMTCGSEHIHNEDHVLKINFEYLEE
jgi:transposase-like protein/DNA-directed RNA polymerase subunit RPC12/RpoP